jgi:hypothetical protein
LRGGAAHELGPTRFRFHNRSTHWLAARADLSAGGTFAIEIVQMDLNGAQFVRRAADGSREDDIRRPGAVEVFADPSHRDDRDADKIRASFV